jgi:hypothetical protein
MKTTYFHNATLNKYGVDITTDKGETFGIACPDEQTARTIAAGLEAIELLEQMVHENEDILRDARKLLTSLQP